MDTRWSRWWFDESPEMEARRQEADADGEEAEFIFDIEAECARIEMEEAAR